MKMDYNDTVGMGCDGYESIGEGLRQNMAAAREFVEKVKKEIPGIVLENCASGGHRLEPVIWLLQVWHLFLTHMNVWKFRLLRQISTGLSCRVRVRARALYRKQITRVKGFHIQLQQLSLEECAYQEMCGS